MKIFSSKKDTANTPEATTEVYKSTDDLSALNLEKDPMDTFSLDSLDLDALNDGSHPVDNHAPLTSTTTTGSTAAVDDVFSFDDFDLDSLNEPVATPSSPNPLHSSIQNTPLAVDTPTSAANPSNDLTDVDILAGLDDLDFGTPTPATAQPAVTVVNNVDTTDDLPNLDDLDFGDEPSSNDALVEGATVAAPIAAGAAAVAMDKDNPTNRPVPPIHTNEQPLKTPNKKPWFGKKEKAPKATVTTTTTRTTKPVVTGKKPNNNRMLMLLLPAILLAAGAWYFLTQMNNDEPAPAATPVPVAKPKSAAPVASTPASTAASTATATASDTASTVTATASTASSTADVTPVKTVSPEEILAPAVPNDPALAKEEMDRLAEQSQQLKDQEKIIEDQLAMMNELSSKKEERIKLLEQQVAQLEQQKAAEKMGKATAPAK